MSQTIGMDPLQVRHFARSLENAAGDLELLGMQISGSISSVPWRGSDADSFRSGWSTRHRPTLTRIADSLRQAALVAGDNADAQDQTSDTGSAGSRVPVAAGSTAGSADTGSGNNDGGWLADGWDWVSDGAGWITETTADTADWFQDRAELGFGNIHRSFMDYGEQSAHLVSLLDQWVGGSPPTLMELAATGMLIRGEWTEAKLTVLTLGQWDLPLLDDGTSWAGEPIPVGVSASGTGTSASGHAEGVLPTDLRAIAMNTAQAYSDRQVESSADGSVRITRVDGPSGPSYIVNIPGTQEWSPATSITAADLTGNLVTASGQLSTASEAVALAMERAGIESGAPVMLAGHSQGGMTAAALAADPAFSAQFNVTNVMAYGSPIDGTAVPAEVRIIAFQHENDVVPMLDLGGASMDGSIAAQPSSVQVTLPDPPNTGWWDVKGQHDFNAYAASISDAEDDHGSTAALYAQDPLTERFLTDDPARVESFVIPIERR